jgi:cytochrome P450
MGVYALLTGHDTTASGISWTLYSLAQSPDCQVKCQQEVDEVLQGRDTDELSW